MRQWLVRSTREAVVEADTAEEAIAAAQESDAELVEVVVTAMSMGDAEDGGPLQQ